MRGSLQGARFLFLGLGTGYRFVYFKINRAAHW